MRRPAGILFTGFFLSGATGPVCQVLWLRLLAPILGRTVHAITTVLAAFMAGLTPGSLLFGRWSPRMRDQVSTWGCPALGIAMVRLRRRGEALEALESIRATRGSVTRSRR